MKLVIISDTHCQQIPVPDGDVLIHCGDHTYQGRHAETVHALGWLSDLPHKYKLIIAGNHELGWENPTKRRFLFKNYPRLTYLHETGIEIEGIKFWGSPYQPYFMNWAFNRERGSQLQAHWAKIPDDTDVLITHGPPYGLGDTNGRDPRFGDEDLLKRVLEVKPTIHCYGHAHHGYGERFFEGIHFINAAILNEDYMIAHKPVEVEIN